MLAYAIPILASYNPHLGEEVPLSRTLVSCSNEWLARGRRAMTITGLWHAIEMNISPRRQFPFAGFYPTRVDLPDPKPAAVG